MWALLTALATIFGPIIAAGVTVWLDKKHTERENATLDETDTYIKQHLQGEPAGLRELSRQLDSLQRKAARRLRDS